MDTVKQSSITDLKPPASADREEVYRFVVDFYSQIRAHPVLGPIFNNQVGDHWDAHFHTLTDFWMTVLHSVPGYKGNPFLAHRKTAGIEPQQFDIWLEIFEQSAKRMLSADLAEQALFKAKRIADSLRQGLFYKPA